MITITLSEIPTILMGVDTNLPKGEQHRFWNAEIYVGLIPDFTYSIERCKGGNTYGCSMCHWIGASDGLTKYPDSPILLLEDDAVMTEWYKDVIEDIPDDADIIWLGRSVYAAHPGGGNGTPEFIFNPDSEFHLLSGACQASHSMLLITTKGKEAWKQCCDDAINGRATEYTDMACSYGCTNLGCKQYVVFNPWFFQPSYAPLTLARLDDGQP